MRVALFSTCIGDMMFPDAVKATAVILSRLGHEVVFPPEQSCCGQMHVNTGYQKEILPQITNYIDAFADPSIDYVVAPSGSCTGAVREQHPMIAKRYGTPAMQAGVETCVNKTFDLSEFLVDVLGITDVGAYFPHSVTYHSTCHSMRTIHVGEKPYQLLRAVEGLELRDLPESDTCCGFGGTFSVKNAETSQAMLADKMSNVLSTGAEFLTAGDASCLMNIGGGLRKDNAEITVLHMAEILASTKDHPWTVEKTFYRTKALAS